MSVAREVCPGFVVDNGNKETIRDLFNYFYRINGRLDLSKGVLLAGEVGTGKTTLMKIFSEVMKRRMQGFKVYNCTDVCQMYAKSGELDLFLENRNGYLQEPVDMCFDELGREPKATKHFGSELNVMQHILHVRYGLFQTQGIKTYVTSNCDAGEIELFYDSFIRDRFREMMNLVTLNGESRRV